MIHLKRELAAGLDGPTPDLNAVMTALQNAIELEHATIPLYLYALYSLDEARNADIAEILDSVVIEEMLHMTLACNVLNALGGTPQIDTPNFIPPYPGALPGGVEAGLTVQLAPFSMTQLDAFLTIESPEDKDKLNFKTMLTDADEPLTIGKFYRLIQQAIGLLGDGAFAPGPRNQVGPDLMPEAVVVTDVASAQAALEVIIEQGEGTTNSPLEVVGSDYAHYYRYMQIKKGHRLVPTPNGGPNPEDKYAYSGAPISLDTAGVYAAPVQGVNFSYPAGSPQAVANETFNYTYTSLLKSLHAMFGGDNSQAQFRRALGLMMSLKSQAKAMMSGLPNPAIIAGPTFQYQPVNPLTGA